MTKGINVLSLCDGISCAHIALDRAGIQVDNYFASEIKDIAIQVTQDNYPNTVQIGDVNKVTYKDGILSNGVDSWKVNIDLVCFGSPCFVGDSLVYTKQGYVPIKDIKIGDYVLSHDNNFHVVTYHQKTGIKKITELVAMGVDTIRTTENHKFLVRKKVYKWNSLIERKERSYTDPEWKEVKDLDNTYLVGIPINHNFKLPSWGGLQLYNGFKNDLINYFDKEEFWYIIGRFLGDGWIVKNYKKNKGHRYKYTGIKICCNKKETSSLLKQIQKVYPTVTLTHERTVDKIQISSMELAAFCEQFGQGAKNKYIPNFVLDLPKYLLQSFVEGYFDADGHYDKEKNTFSCTTISQKIVLGIQQCMLKLYHILGSVSYQKREKTRMIEGRIVNQNDSYLVRWHMSKKTFSNRNFIIENNYCWTPIRKINFTNNKEEVYDITVDQSHSFTVNNTIVHNCQSFSIAMNTKGRVGLKDKIRSGLYFECKRVLDEVNPKYFFVENVGSMKEADVEFLSTSLGVPPIRINSKLVAPAMRDRYYWTNIGYTPLEKKDICLQDILEDGYTQREKARALMRSGGGIHGYQDYIKLYRRVEEKGFGNLIYSSKEAYEQCKNIYDTYFKKKKIKELEEIEEEHPEFQPIFKDNIRYLSQREQERCQTLPEGYTKSLEWLDAQDVIGDGWTVDVIVAFFQNIK